MLAHTVQYVLSSLVPRPHYCIASYEMLGGAWDAGRGLGTRLCSVTKAALSAENFSLLHYRHRDVAR